MLDLGPHASFIIAAYGVTVLAVGALILATLADDHKQRRILAELERKGIRRRSATRPAKPKVTSKAAKTSKPRTAPRSANAATKRTSGASRAGKTQS